jgi:hypothetical protein
MDLTKCIYENIKNNFYYGLFGDFRLVIDKDTGYFNATKLCIEGGKNYFEWNRLKKSKDMIKYYQESCPGNSQGSFLYEIKLQNNDDLNKQVTGTYVPKELILDIASWVSIEFYDKCNKIVIDYFINEFKKMDDQDLKNKIKHLKKELKGTKEELKDTKEKFEDVKEELEDTKEHALILQEMIVKDDPMTRTQVIYIATTELYARNNNFKSGGVDETNKLKSRLSTYNTGRVKDDLFYYSDIFMISNYHIIEAQLKNLLGRFRDKKEKEMYRLHYTDMRYIVDYLCKRDGEDVEEVNLKLTQFISNLNKRNLRPIVPPPNTTYLTSVTHLKEDGTVDNVTIQSDSFEEAVKEYVKTLDPNITEISKKKVFDDLKVRKNRTQKFPILEQILGRLRPEILLLKKS